MRFYPKGLCLIIRNASIRVFRVFGISVYIHWAWIVLAIIVSTGSLGYDELNAPLARLALFLALMTLVMLHEFGHALACRSVGGRADTIILWPLGGLALVEPPPRPGPYLWAIVAGPLVNVVMIPVLGVLWLGSLFIIGNAQFNIISGALFFTNIVMLVLNLLPVYPLDGGQILQALLWMVMPRGTALLIASILGMIGAVGLVVLALLTGHIMLAAIGVFIGLQSCPALRVSQTLRMIESQPQRPGLVCPHCHELAPVLDFGRCGCGRVFDPFATGGVCPACGRVHELVQCPRCARTSPGYQWVAQPGGPR